MISSSLTAAHLPVDCDRGMAASDDEPSRHATTGQGWRNRLDLAVRASAGAYIAAPGRPCYALQPAGN